MNKVIWQTGFGALAILLVLTACAPNITSPAATALPVTESPVPSTETPVPSATQLQPTETLLPSPTPTLEIPAVLEAGTTIIDGDGSTLVYIPAGKFLMGAKGDGSEYWTPPDYELPQHGVTLDAFWIDQTEVSNKQYKACVDAGRCNAPIYTATNFTDSYFGNPQYDDHPVLEVQWKDALSYCAWVNRRLPTEAEWEKAARGTDGRIYPWGNEEPFRLDSNLLNYNNEIGTTTPVTEPLSDISPYGVYNMAGNAREWVADWFSPTYYSISPSTNPLGPDAPPGQVAGFPENHVIRGGNYASDSFATRTTSRGFSSHDIGFRCARSE